MSLIGWSSKLIDALLSLHRLPHIFSAPKRCAGDRHLPIIPNEIHLIIFEHLAPISTRLSSQQILTLFNLSCTCRFFANLCLPRIFEYLEFSGCIFSGDDILPSLDKDTAHMASRARILCQRITAKEPRALSIAQCVKAGRFTDWEFGVNAPRAVHPFSQLYLSGMAHMKNIRKLEFFRSSVKKLHWDVIATLELLEELSFAHCDFVDGPADVVPGKRLKVKVPCLRVYGCSGSRQPSAAIDPRHLRTLATDHDFADQVDWLSDTALTELRVFDYTRPVTMHSRTRVTFLLRQIPQSIQVLRLPFYTFSNIDEPLFGDPAWKKMSLLCSLTLEEVWRGPGIAPMTVVRTIFDGIRVLGGLQSLTLKAWGPHLDVGIPSVDVRHKIQEQLSDIPGLNLVDIYGTAVRLVDGKWMDVRDRAL
ncbi:hypothetical protein PAXRUDRAFT_16865 [Paxillus rubicundulus Ve08.2h10]|uniref:F-box domain-containing protein n=1 Tax=Paxillus rubicundulus Ve08.2h10 TaxID=930991 RepID=A0A0D0DCS1_9AGAM|nr:hypothetical protein PAXRUDRAFT_16865 [Paxillus rubicundulus Ve08.2h10]